LSEPSFYGLIDELLEELDEEQPFTYECDVECTENFSSCDEKKKCCEKKCECGVDSLDGGIHSSYCPLYEKEK